MNDLVVCKPKRLTSCHVKDKRRFIRIFISSSWNAPFSNTKLSCPRCRTISASNSRVFWDSSSAFLTGSDLWYGNDHKNSEPNVLWTYFLEHFHFYYRPVALHTHYFDGAQVYTEKGCAMCSCWILHTLFGGDQTHRVVQPDVPRPIATSSAHSSLLPWGEPAFFHRLCYEWC